MLLLKLIKKILNADLYIICLKDKTGKYNTIYSDNTDNDFHVLSAILLRSDFINKVGQDEYGKHLEEYDLDLFNIYKECDYQIAKSDYLQAELDYYKEVNNPNSGDANKLYMMYQHLLKLKSIYKSFEE